MNKKQAIRLVASHLAGNAEAGSLEEACGLDQSELEQLSAADLARLEWAVAHVAARLRYLGRD